MSSGIERPPNAHRQLFEQYVADMRETLDEVRRRNSDRRIVWGNAGAFTHIAAAKADEDRHRLSTHPRVIAVMRRYFFACCRLNEERPPDEFILPSVFAVEMLTAVSQDLFTIFTDLPYIPIGLDEKDRYV